MKTKLPILILVILIGAFGYSCKKKSSSSPAGGGGGGGGGSTITIQGTVVDENNNPVAGAAVVAGGISAVSSGSGTFTLNSVPVTSRCAVAVTASGFFDAYRGFEPVPGQTSYLNVMMISKGAPTNFSASAGSAVVDQGGSINISPNSLKDSAGNPFNGTVTAFVRFQSPSQANFGQVMQGGDFAGVNSGNQTGTLSSYGFVSVQLEDGAGKKLDIQNGSNAGFSMPIDPSQLATAPATVKLWTFDKATAMWKEEGTATKVGNMYVGQVGHFSEWNCDDWNTTATIKGKVVCNGTPSANVEVTIINGSNTLYVNTGSTGNFSIKIPSGFDVTVEFDGMNSTSVGPLTTGQIYDMGNVDICDTNSSSNFLNVGGVSYPIIEVDDTTMTEGYYLGAIDNNDSEINILFPSKPMFNSTYNVIPVVFPLAVGSGQAIIYLDDMTSGLEYYSSGGGQIVVTIAAGKVRATFSNIPMLEDGGSVTTTVSGDFTSP